MSTIKLETNNRMNWADLSDSDSEDEAEEKNLESNFKETVSKQLQEKNLESNFKETVSKQLQENYKSISDFLNKSKKIPTDDNFCKRITLLLIVICCRFSIQICEYRSFRTEIQDFFGFTQNKILNKKMKNVNENKVIFKEFIPIFNDILKLVKNAIHIPCTESIILQFQEDLKTDSENINTNIFRRSVPLAFLIECYHLLMIFLHIEVEKNQTHLLKFVKFGNFDKDIAIENPEFPYENELKKLLKAFDTLKSNTNLRLFVSIYYQIKDDLEKIVEKANIEFSKNK